MRTEKQKAQKLRKLKREAALPIRLTFEDHGQDFTTWDVMPDGRIIDCRPFQGDIWGKYMVYEPAQLCKGKKVNIYLPGQEGNPKRWLVVKHPLVSAERISLKDVRKTYLLVTIRVIDGEHEYTFKHVEQMRLTQKENEVADRRAKNWGRASTREKDGDTWTFEAGCLAVRTEKWEYISEDVYKLLKKYL